MFRDEFVNVVDEPVLDDVGRVFWVSVLLKHPATASKDDINVVFVLELC